MFFLYDGRMLPTEYRLKKEEEIKTLFKKGAVFLIAWGGQSPPTPRNRFVVIVGVGF